MATVELDVRSLRAAAVAGLSAVQAAEWDALVPAGNAPLRHGYLTAWEEVDLPGLRSRPVVLRAAPGEPPLAACPGYFYDLDLATIRSPGTSALVSAVRRHRPGFLFARVYELGNPTPLTNPFLVADADLRPQAARALVRAGIDEAARGDAELVVVQNFHGPRGPAEEALAELGFARVAMPPTAVVELGHESFDDYLGAMRAPYRRRARQALKRSAELEPETLADFAGLAEELARLWERVYERADEVKREILTPAFFRAASRLDETSVLLLRRRDGSIASFGLLLGEREQLAFLHCGFEAEAGRDEGAYFRLLYEIVRTGIEGGFDRVDLGMTTIEPKLDVGAVPVPLFAWVRHRNPLVQRVLLALARGPLRPDDVQPRRVFKAPAASRRTTASQSATASESAA